MALLDDLKTALDGGGVTGGSTGWATYLGYMPPTPDMVVVAFEAGGDPPDQSSGTRYAFPSFQIQVRGSALGYEAARTKMDEVLVLLDDGTVSGLTFVFAANSGVIPLGLDENDRPRLAVTFDAMGLAPT